MNSVTLSVEKKELIQEVMKKHGFNNIKILEQGKAAKGDGYMGTIDFIKVVDVKGSREIDLVLKSAKTSEKFRKASPVKKFFLREIYMYETIHPALLCFQNKMAILKPFTGVTNMYGTSALEFQEALLLENIKATGWSLWNRKVPMGADHVSLVFKEYAKFHAISLAMKELEPDNFKKLTAEMTSLFDESAEEGVKQFVAMQQGLFQKAMEAVEHCSSVVKDSLKKFSNELLDFVMKDLENPDDQLVVQHADCWCNNMMFKYEDSTAPTNPTKVCFLDWQMSRVGSPVVDLSYFFFVCASLDVIKDCKKYLLLYYDTIAENLRNFGCNPAKTFPYELLEAHWHKLAKYGLFATIFLTNILLRDSEDAPDLAEIAEAGQNVMEAIVKSTPNNPDMEEAYRKRISGVVTFMVENGLL